jgi:phosphoribosylanthranilate isomerase
VSKRVRVKVCCIASRAEARIALEAGADMLGLVGAMPSGPGPISDDAIAAIADWAPPGITSVLLSSDTSAAGLVAHARRCRAQALQIVAPIAPGVLAQVRRDLVGVRIMPVVHVEDGAAIDAAVACAPFADAVLLDSGRPGQAELGGTGRVHDWAISRAIVAALDRPVILAGGLNVDNVAEAIAAVRPYGVDLCSGVRTNGHLDADKLARFVAAVAA